MIMTITRLNIEMTYMDDGIESEQCDITIKDLSDIICSHVPIKGSCEECKIKAEKYWDALGFDDYRHPHEFSNLRQKK